MGGKGVGFRQRGQVLRWFYGERPVPCVETLDTVWTRMEVVSGQRGRKEVARGGEPRGKQESG